MTRKEIVQCMTSYKNYLERNPDKYSYVNELKYPYTDKAVSVTLFCIDFETKDVDKNCVVQFWVPRKLCWDYCAGGCNAKIPKWLAIKSLEKLMAEEKSN